MDDAEEYRRKAQHFLALAQHLTDPSDRAKMLGLARYWKERADEAERIEPIEQQQQQQTQPKKEPEGERS